MNKKIEEGNKNEEIKDSTDLTFNLNHYFPEEISNLLKKLKF